MPSKLNKTMTLDQYISRQTKNYLNLGKGLLHFIAQDAVNKLAIQPLVIQRAGNSNTLPLRLFKSKFNEERRKMEYKLSQGKRCAMAILTVKGERFFQTMEWIDKTEVANELQSITLLTGNYITIDDAKVQEVIKYTKEATYVSTQTGSWDGKSVTIVSTRSILDTDVIPVQTFKNNQNGTADVIGLENSIAMLNHWSKEFNVEWNKAKLQFGNNKNFGAKKSASEWNQALQSDLDVHDFADPDGTFQSPLAQMTGAVNTVAQLFQQYNWLEDTILKYSFIQRDSTSASGTNKHNLEVATFNQQSFEYLLAKKIQREEDFKWLFWKLNVLDKQPDVMPAVTNPISELEMLKLDSMKADVALKQAQAQAALNSVNKGDN